MESVNLEIKRIVTDALAESGNGEKLATGKTMSQIADDCGIKNPSKAVVTALGMAIRKLNLKTKRTSKGRLTFCDDWDALYESLGVNTGRTTEPQK